MLIGIVFGALNRNGTIDIERLKMIRTLSEGMILTFHRAFDVCKDPMRGIEEIISARCDRLLTSGNADTAISGISNLKKFVEVANGRIQIIAGSGISPNNAGDVVSKSAVDGVHAGRSVTTKTPFEKTTDYGDEDNNFEVLLSPDMYQWECVDGDLVWQLVEKSAEQWKTIRKTPFPEFSSPVSKASSSSSYDMSVPSNSPRKPSNPEQAYIYVQAD